MTCRWRPFTSFPFCPGPGKITIIYIRGERSGTLTYSDPAGNNIQENKAVFARRQGNTDEQVIINCRLQGPLFLNSSAAIAASDKRTPSTITVWSGRCQPAKHFIPEFRPLVSRVQLYQTRASPCPGICRLSGTISNGKQESNCLTHISYI